MVGRCRISRYGSTRGYGGTEVQIRVLAAVNARGEREIHSYRLSSLYPRYAHGFESKWGDEEEASCRRKGKGREGKGGKGSCWMDGMLHDCSN